MINPFEPNVSLLHPPKKLEISWGVEMEHCGKMGYSVVQIQS